MRWNRMNVIVWVLRKFPVAVAGALGMWKLVPVAVGESNVPPVDVQLLNTLPELAVAVYPRHSNCQMLA